MNLRDRPHVLFACFVVSALCFAAAAVWFHMRRLLGFAVLLLVSVAIVIIDRIQKQRRLAMLSSGREPLPMEEIYARYYSDSGITKEVVGELWQEIAKSLGLPAGKLRPEDELAKLSESFVPLITPELETLADEASRRLKKSGKAADLSAIKTVDDYIRTLGKL